MRKMKNNDEKKPTCAYFETRVATRTEIFIQNTFFIQNWKLHSENLCVWQNSENVGERKIGERKERFVEDRETETCGCLSGGLDPQNPK